MKLSILFTLSISFLSAQPIFYKDILVNYTENIKTVYSIKINEQKSFKQVWRRCRIKNSYHSLLQNQVLAMVSNRNETNKDDLDTLSRRKILLTAITGSVLFGIMGALVGYSYRSRRYQTGVFATTIGNDEGAQKGAAIGGAAGSIMGFLAHRKQLKQKYPFVRIIIGSILGGVSGYFFSDFSFGVSSLLLPPIGANILLYF